MATISTTRETRITKDKANILNMKQCNTFIKDYKDYINGKISQIKHPKTNKIIREAAKVKYVYNKCIEKYDINTSPASISKLTKLSKQSSKLSSTDKNTKTSKSIDYEKEINILNNIDIRDILNLPNGTFKDNRALIKSLFKVPISEKIGFEVLKKYLNDPNNNSKHAISYREYVREIVKLIPIYDPFMKKKDFRIYVLKKFNPIKEVNREAIFAFIEYCQKLYLSSIIQDSRNLNLGNFIYNENYRGVTTAAGFYTRLAENKYIYYSFYYCSKIILDGISSDIELIQNLAITKIMMKNLVDKNFLIEDPNVSLSFSTSSSSSNSDNMTDKDSSMNTIYRQLGKKEFVKYIMNNGEKPRTVNDSDPYLGVKWEKLSLNKLKMVVKISHVLNGRTFTYAYYAISLYKDWKNSIRNRKPFINPINRIPFTEEDENTILNVLDKKYSLIGRPTQRPVGRHDIYYQDTELIRDYGIDFLRLNIWFNTGTQERTNYIRIFSINIIANLPIYHSEGSDVEFNLAFLFENIEQLKYENKIISKKIPFKLHPAFVKYYNSYITTEEQYKDFFTLIRRSV
jgi:hypothetical protein